MASTFCAAAQVQLATQKPMHASLPEAAQAKDCLMCHQSYKAVAEKTAKVNPNPHDSYRCKSTARTATA